MAEGDTPEQAKARQGGSSRLADERPLDADGRRNRWETYHPKFCDTVRKLGKLGAIELEIADYIGCSLRDLRRWRVDHPEFDEAMRAGFAPADDRVEHGLYMLATGFEVEEERLVVIDGKVERHAVRRYYKPDKAAAETWLCNRRPADWRKTREYAPPPPPPEAPTIGEDELRNRLLEMLLDAQARAGALQLAGKKPNGSGLH